MVDGTVEIVEHTADWAIRVTAPDLAALLVTAARGLNRLLVDDPALVNREISRDIDLQAYDAESLLVAFLSELVYWAETEQLLMRDFELFEVTPLRLRARAHGGSAVEMDKHVKAVTYHDLAIEQTAEGLQVTIVFDV